MKKNLIGLLLFIFVVGCTPPPPSAADIPTPITKTQVKNTPLQTLAKNDVAQADPTKTKTPTFTQTTPPPSPTNTEIPTEATSVPTEPLVDEPTVTPEINHLEFIQSLNEKGLITSTKAQYHTLDDFEQSWAQIDWYRWWNSGYKPVDFVMRSQVEWESASRTANWDMSGCGYVFGAEDQDNHSMLFLALDGKVQNFRIKNGEMTWLKSGDFGRVDFMKGNAQLTLIVEEKQITFFVNDKQVLRMKDPYMNEGDLAFTVNSGTNVDFGTRCKMSKNELWVLEK